MIPRTILPDTSLALSRLTFGTSRLFSAGKRADRQKILAAAAAAGFSHFDTAPSYGFGMAERDLGDVFGDDPQVTLTTKTGLYSPGGEDQSWPAIFARKLAGRFVPVLSSAIADWSVDRARRELDLSLKRLRRNRVDVLLLHEPDLPLLDTDQWQRWMSEEKGSRVGFFGIAVDAGRLSAMLTAPRPMLEVVQTQDSVSGHEASPLLKAARTLQFTYGYLSALPADKRSRSEVRQTIQLALARNNQGSVIVSSNNVHRVHELAAAALC
jgi:D-threo-aldose 1-dehydrogenase